MLKFDIQIQSQIYCNIEMSRQLLIITTLILASTALHLPVHNSPESYLATLQSKQASTSTQLSSLKADVLQVEQQVSTEGDKAKKIKILEEAIMRHRGLLANLAVGLAIPLNESSWTCQTYTSTSDAEIKNLVSSITASTAVLDQTANQITNKTAAPYFSQETSTASQLAAQIQKSIYSTGTVAPTLTTGKQTNFQANNWIVGPNKTTTDVNQQVGATDSSTGYLTMCPVVAPFFDGTNCIACPVNQYFNWETKKCVTCMNVDLTTHKCNDPPPLPPVVKPTISNFNSSLDRIILEPSIDVQSLKNTVGQACPSTTPFLTNNGCINCQSPNTLFNYSTKTCSKCPTDQIFIQDKHACIVVTKSIKVTNLPAGQNKLILPSGVTIDTLQAQQQELSKTGTLDVCPIDKPFFNNVDCISCPADQYFATDRSICVGCASGERYDEKLHQCIRAVYYTNLANRNWTSTNPDSIRNDVKAANATSGALICPLDKPFFDGNTCVGCLPTQQFNFDGKKCQICSLGNIFSPNLHSCIPYQPNAYQTNPTTTPNLIYDGTSISQYMQQYRTNLQQHPHMIDCNIKDPSRPYYDGISCIKCPTEYPLFNLKEKVCQVCAVGAYDSVEHQCMSNNNQIISQSPNIQKILASIFT